MILSEEQIQIREMARSFAADRLTPSERRMVQEIVAELREHGLLRGGWLAAWRAELASPFTFDVKARRKKKLRVYVSTVSETSVTMELDL